MVSFNCMRETQKQFADPVGSFILFHVYGRRSPRSLPIEIHLKIIINCFARNKDTLLFRDHHNWHWSLDTLWGSWKPISPIRHGVHQPMRKEEICSNTERRYQTNKHHPVIPNWYHGTTTIAHHHQAGLMSWCPSSTTRWSGLLAFYAIYQYATISFDPPGPGQTLYYTCPETLCCFILVWTGQDYRRSWRWSWGFCLLLVLSPITKVISLLHVGWAGVNSKHWTLLKRRRFALLSYQ